MIETLNFDQNGDVRCNIPSKSYTSIVAVTSEQFQNNIDNPLRNILMSFEL